MRKFIQPTKNSSIFIFSVKVGVLWTFVLCGLFAWSLKSEIRHTTDVFNYQSRAFFQEIVAARYWNAAHGGVYVPVTEKTRPNPYLDVPDRDVITVNGLVLTKVNPAYMTRQIGEIASDRNLAWFHITSAKPIRPANRPDAWETAALSSFPAGTPECSEYIESADGTQIFRYMAPLWVKRPCLKCHAKQGYKEGDLRGGISVSIQATPVIAVRNRQIQQLSFAYLVIWILGLLGIYVGMSRLSREEAKREKTILQLEDALAEVKTLSGLLPICAACKKVRDDKGYWNQIESYIQARSEAEFSHGICPQCAEELYPDLDIYERLTPYL